MPRGHSVTTVGNVFDLEIATVVRFCEVRSWADNYISRHFRVYVAQHGHDPWLSECERTFFTLRPSSEIVPRLLITINRGPKGVMLHGVAVQELHRCALLNDENVWRKHQAFLIHDWMVLGSRKRLASNGV